ncbi:MAG: ABC transporter permease [Metamycoplasmataceae bacterium]|uniref:ABC transporter permease n=1 Tax=Mycoplasmopsis lipophila TaxID=2117 RepID=UPI0038732386
MFKYLGKRIAFAFLALLVIIIFVYTLVYKFAPNPVKAANLDNWTKYSPEEQKQKLLDAGFGQPVLVAFFKYLKNVFSGDWGQTWTFQSSEAKTIPELFFKPLKYSIIISLPAFIISAIFGIALGTFSGYKRGKIIDTSINTFILIFIALPSFVIAPIFINIGKKIGLPHKVFDFYDKNNNQPITTIILSLINPILVITLGSLAGYTIYTRNQVITVLTSNYVLIAKTKGLSNTTIFFKYVLRNISIPLAAMLIPSYIGLLSGSIIIEIYWQVPGTSTILSQSFPNGEINLIMFSTIFFTTLSLFTEILVDVSYVILDPRIKYAENSGNNLKLWLTAYLYRKKLFKKIALENTQAQQGGNNE